MTTTVVSATGNWKKRDKERILTALYTLICLLVTDFGAKKTHLSHFSLGLTEAQKCKTTLHVSSNTSHLYAHGSFTIQAPIAVIGPFNYLKKNSNINYQTQNKSLGFLKICNTQWYHGAACKCVCMLACSQSSVMGTCQDCVCSSLLFLGLYPAVRRPVPILSDSLTMFTQPASRALIPHWYYYCVRPH